MMSSLYSFVWISVVSYIEFHLASIIIRGDTTQTGAIIFTAFLRIFTITVHYLLWWSSSTLGMFAFYGLSFMIFSMVFLVAPGATAVTRGILHYMGIGGGIEVELQLYDAEFRSVSDALELKTDKEAKCPCSTGKIILIFDAGDILYVRKIADKPNQNAQNTLRTVSIRRINIASINYHKNKFQK